MYNYSMVTFIDILGFKELIKERPAEDINSLLKKFEQFTILSKDSEHFPSIIAFSDTVVRVKATNLKDPKHGTTAPQLEFMMELNDVLLAQAKLIAVGCFIRGSIVYGKIFHESNRVFGPALVEAYELESNFAKYPRIIISPKLRKLLDKHDDSTTGKILNRLILKPPTASRDRDGLFFLDYLTGFYSWACDEILNPQDVNPIETVRIFYKHHKKLILTKIFKHQDNKKILSKYIWCANYHNYALKKMAKFSKNLSKEDLFISEI